MHDTFDVFGTRLEELRELWRSTVAPQLPARSATALSRTSKVLFGNLSDDIRRAAEIAPERTLSSAAIREACYFGFTEVFS